jgi:type IX secretion system PorP/SprF family membrane protein
LNHNPAFAGIFDGDQRFSAVYKQQWQTVPVDYMTFTGSYDRNFIDITDPDLNGFFSAGILFNYDQAGDSKLSLLNFSLTGAYTQALSNNVYLTGGAQLGVGQRSFKTAELTWDNQWDGSTFDPTRDPRENFSDTQFGFLDLGAGLNLHIQSATKRSKLDLGLGAFHLNKPQNSFYDDADSKLPVRIAYNLQAVLQLASRLDIMLNGLYHTQSEYQETVLNGYLNIHLSTKKAREIQLMLGAGIRIDDAFYPQIAIAYDGWKVGFSYDINTSPFQAATNQTGGPELSLVYIIKRPRPLLETKNCRIF